MSEAVMETDCTRCIKKDVYKYKDDFLNAQAQIERANISIGNCRSKELRYFEFILPVGLRCKYRIEGVNSY